MSPSPRVLPGEIHGHGAVAQQPGSLSSTPRCVPWLVAWPVCGRARALTLPTAQRDRQVLTGNGMAGEAEQLAFAPCHLLLAFLVRSQR